VDSPGGPGRGVFQFGKNHSDLPADSPVGPTGDPGGNPEASRRSAGSGSARQGYLAPPGGGGPGCFHCGGESVGGVVPGAPEDGGTPDPLCRGGCGFGGRFQGSGLSQTGRPPGEGARASSGATDQHPGRRQLVSARSAFFSPGMESTRWRRSPGKCFPSCGNQMGTGSLEKVS